MRPAFQHTEKSLKALPDWRFLFLFPAVLFYYETVFRLSTVGGYVRLGTAIMLLFSFSYGGIGYLLSTLFKNPKANRAITATLIGLSALPFLVEYFVYRAFKVFYDLNTVAGGAGDAVGGFSGDIFHLVFSLDGFFKLLLFALPFVLYLVLGKRFLPANRAYARLRIIAAGGMLVFYLAGILLISFSSVYRPMYRTEYNYQSAVGNFGLLTGLRLDIRKALFGAAGRTFESAPAAPEETPAGPAPAEPSASEPEGEEEGGSSTPPDRPREYPYNQMTLDFQALSESASGTLAELDQYVGSLTPSRQNQYTGLFKGKNLIMISAEAFSAEVIDPVLTPTLYRLATKGIQFTDYYQPASAGTTGGEYENLFGLMPTAGGMSFKKTADHLNYFTMGNQLDRLGYYGRAFHNNTYTYYDRHKTHINLGYSDGFMGYGNGMEAYVQNQWPQSDWEMIAGTLPTIINRQPFNVYYMTVSGHGGYGRYGNAMTNKNWDRVASLDYSDPVKGYLAANLELEDAMAHLVAELEKQGIADNTVICIAADHFPYGLDSDASLGKMPYLSELYGETVSNLLQRDHSRLILWCGSLEKEDPIVVDTPTFSLDILPTLSNLFGTEFDSRLLPGRDVFSDAEALVFNMNYDWKTEYGVYIASTGVFTPADEGREIPEGYVSRIRTLVRNKIHYCESVLETDYYAHVFGK